MDSLGLSELSALRVRSGDWESNPVGIQVYRALWVLGFGGCPVSFERASPPHPEESRPVLLFNWRFDYDLRSDETTR